MPKLDKFKCDILSNFQTQWMIKKEGPLWTTSFFAWRKDHHLQISVHKSSLENDFLTSLINSVRPQYIVIRLNVVVLLNSLNLQPRNCSSIDFDFRLLSFSKKALFKENKKWKWKCPGFRWHLWSQTYLPSVIKTERCTLSKNPS